MRRTIVNAGPMAWAFEDFARRMSDVLWAPIADRVDHDDAYWLLAWDGSLAPTGHSFVPWEAIMVASDKRLIAERFASFRVPSPDTTLAATWAEVLRIVAGDARARWALKYPTASGGAGHRMVSVDSVEPHDWPKPFVVQRFVEMARPEVFRLFAVRGETFGFNVRRFPSDVAPSPWVAHARGARYESAGAPPEEAVEVARAALEATGLQRSFGCVDLIQSGERWLALEVGTDGASGHVDRDVGDASLVDEIDRRVAEAFWADSPSKPWGGKWRRRERAEW